MQKQREKNKKMYFEQITKKRLIYRFKNSIVKSKINVVKLNLPIIKSPDLIWRSVLLYGYDIALFDIFVNFLKFLKIFNILFLKHNNFGNNIKFKNFFLNSDLQKYLKVKFKKWKKKKKRKIKFKIIKRKKYRFKKFKKKTRKDFDNRFYKWWKHKFNFKFLLVLKKKLAIEFKNPPWVKIGRHWKPPVFSKVQTWSRNFISSNGWYHHYYKGWSASDYVYWSKYKNYENLFLRSKLFWLRKLNFFHWFFYYKLSNRNKKHQQHIFKKFNVSEFLLYKKQYPRIKRNKKLYNKWKNLLLLKKFSEFRKKIIYRKFKKFKIGQWKMWLRFSRKSFNTIPLIFRKFARINSFKFYRRRLRKFLFNWKLILFQVVNKINYLHVRKFDKFLKYKKLFYKIAFFTFQRFLFKKRKPHRVLSKLKKLDYNWVLSRLRKKKKNKHNKKIIKYYERFIEKKNLYINR